jgi:hemoglobin-like flavoprotein
MKDFFKDEFYKWWDKYKLNLDEKTPTTVAYDAWGEAMRVQANFLVKQEPKVFKNEEEVDELLRSL